MLSRVINLELVSNPLNWVIIPLMLAISAAFLALILSEPNETGPTQ